MGLDRGRKQFLLSDVTYRVNRRVVNQLSSDLLRYDGPFGRRVNTCVKLASTMWAAVVDHVELMDGL